MRRILGYLLVVLVACTVPASSQVLGTGVMPVVEVGPTASNATITALQSTISAVEDVIQSGYALLNLTPLDEIVIAAEYLETLALLQELVAEGTALIGDAQQAQAQIEALFGVFDAPRTPLALHQRVTEIHVVLFEARNYAVRVQTLIASINSAVGHVISMVEIIGVLAGNLQGQQVQIQLLTTLNGTMATHTTQAAAWQRVDVLDKAARMLIAESFYRIEADRWSDWPVALGGAL